jgi:hypothetical protein
MCFLCWGTHVSRRVLRYEFSSPSHNRHPLPRVRSHDLSFEGAYCELKDMSKLAIAWRTSTIYYARFHQAERSFKSCLTALSVLHRLPSCSLVCLLWTLLTAMSSCASEAKVCGLALLLSGLTIVGSAVDLQREHNEQDTSWLFELHQIILPKEG